MYPALHLVCLPSATSSKKTTQNDDNWFRQSLTPNRGLTKVQFIFMTLIHSHRMLTTDAPMVTENKQKKSSNYGVINVVISPLKLSILCVLD